ncbi:hypothetical protein EVAR_24393_1 [Eumeta japonica]|uniref:Uncharacterized protein n=1 Tax=Eumeta variegata TaxID=151549 RepID=A0A4C1VUH7_EUMVA|nr:hypothetical protein EVAR_24393_1 [Eumeta japonica]
MKVLFGRIRISATVDNSRMKVSQSHRRSDERTPANNSLDCSIAISAAHIRLPSSNQSLLMAGESRPPPSTEMVPAPRPNPLVDIVGRIQKATHRTLGHSNIVQ